MPKIIKKGLSLSKICRKYRRLFFRTRCIFRITVKTSRCTAQLKLYKRVGFGKRLHKFGCFNAVFVFELKARTK